MNSLESFRASTSDALLEATMFGDLVPWSDFPQNDWDGGVTRGGYQAPFVNFRDREDGRFMPFYQFEQDLSFQIAMVRRLIGFNELTEAVSTALKVYIFGAGVEISVQAARKMEPPPELIDGVRRIVEVFSEQNNLVNNLDLELHQRSRDDGECVLPLEREGNRIICEPVETIQLTEPPDAGGLAEWVEHRHKIDCNSFEASWSFGILTRKDRPSRPLAYHILRSQSGDFDTYSVEECVHVKRNVPRAAKRGVSDWIAPLDRLSMVVKLATSMGRGAALQAAIPWIEEYATATTAQIQRDGSTSPDGQRPNGRGNSERPEWSSRYNPGSVIRTKFGKKFLPGPMGQGRENGFELVGQMLERWIATRWLMPYQLISGDYSNNAFASSLMAEAPFVKAREADQQFYGGVLKSLLWKVVRMAWRFGWLDTRGIRIDDLERWIDIKVDFTSPASRDKLELIQQLTAEVGLGILSTRTAAVEMGRDYDEEVASGAKPTSGVSPDGTSQGPGVLSTLGARQGDVSRSRWVKVLTDFKDAKISRVVAKGMLLALSVPDATAEAYLDDAAKGQIDTQALAESLDALMEAGNPNHDSDGKFGSGISVQQPSTNAIFMPESFEEANALAWAARQHIVGDDSPATNGQCIDAGRALRSLGCEIYSGTYLDKNGNEAGGDIGGHHVIAKAGRFYIDITADQFGDDEVRIFSQGNINNGTAFQYGGFRRDRGLEQIFDQQNQHSPQGGLMHSLSEFNDSDRMLSKSKNPTKSAAIQGALESVETTDEARQILEGMYP